MNSSQEKSKVVAIDGPSGSGKSSITKLVAKKLSLLHIDTGAMYRAISVYFHKQSLDLTNLELVTKKLSELELDYGVSDTELVMINGENLTTEIRKHYVSELASNTSQIKVVREYLISFQRELGKNRLCVMEGRDIGTVVFPDSFCKIYLTAQSMERARRRLKELEEKGQKGLTLESIHEDVLERDKMDMSRTLSPLKKADDAITLDSTNLSHEDVIEKICDCVKESAEKYGIKL